MTPRVPRELRKVVKVAQKQGWEVTNTRNGHLVFLSPEEDVKPIYGPTSESDHRSLKNLTAELRRAGLELPRK